MTLTASSSVVDRLNVVLVSRSGLGGKSESLLEAIVGNLAGRPGIDLVLVSPLAEIDDGSTDQLTLLSIGSGAAVLTWTSAEQTMLDLGRIGFKGGRSPHTGDPQHVTGAPQHVAGNPLHVAGPKVYAMDLRDLPSVDDLIAQLDRLRNVQSVKTFSLGVPMTLPVRSEKPAVAEMTAVAEPSESKEATGSGGDSRSQSNRDANKLADENRSRSGIADAGLDDLIDQLDDFDL